MKIVNDLNLDLTQADYKNYTNKFFELCKQCDIDEKKVALFGQVGFPGISDIDVLVINSSENIKRLSSIFEKERTISKNFRYLFCHEPAYVIENTIEDVCRIHSLEGVTSIEEDFTMLESYKQSIAPQEKDILNIVWFITLTYLVADMQKKAVIGPPISLRLILLTYKNILHSLNLFNIDDYEIPNTIMSSTELRTWVKNNYSDKTSNYVWNKFILAYNFTTNIFDIFCQKKVTNNISSNKSSLIISKDLICKEADHTKVSIKLIISKIHVNTYAFKIINDYYNGRSNIKEINDYIKSSANCKKAFMQASIRYCYLEPFMFPPTRLKNEVLFYLNRIKLSRLLT
ncbi:hypothetical protein GCM10027341_53640 [Spirosoma knui]